MYVCIVWVPHTHTRYKTLFMDTQKYLHPHKTSQTTKGRHANKEIKKRLIQLFFSPKKFN